MTQETKLKVLITGAGGMLGTDLSIALADICDVSGLDRKPAPHLTVPYDICDLTHERQTRDAVLSREPKVIFHAAALTDVDFCEENHDEATLANVTATENIVRAANEIDATIVFFSTDYVFDGKKKSPYFETDATSPISFYGKTKQLAEEFILKNAKHAMIFRITWLYGIWGKNFPKAILRQVPDAKELKVVSDQTGSPTWSWDVAQAMYEIIQSHKEKILSAKPDIFHLHNDGFVHWADYARFILKTTGFDDIKILDISTSESRRAAPRPQNSTMSYEKMQKNFGIQMRSWQTATTEFLQKLNAFNIEQAKKAEETIAQKDNTPS